MAEIDVIKEIDARGSACPGPLMELIRALKNVEKGDVVAVLSSDQGSVVDIPEWVEKAKHELVRIDKASDHTRFVIKKTR